MLEAEKWRPLRTKLSPIFTSGKLKEMFPLIADCAKNLEMHLNKLVERNEPVDCRDLAGKFTTDAIGSCAFGLEINSLRNENCEFRKISTKMFRPSVKQAIRDLCREFTPSLYQLIGSYLQIKDIDDFYINLFTSTMKYREENNVVRPDFVQLLMELKKQQNKFDNIGEQTRGVLCFYDVIEKEVREIEFFSRDASREKSILNGFYWYTCET